MTRLLKKSLLFFANFVELPTYNPYKLLKKNKNTLTDAYDLVTAKVYKNVGVFLLILSKIIPKK